MTKASSIIIFYNNFYNLEKCLDSLIRQKYNKKTIDLELIIVNSGSENIFDKISKQYHNKIKIILKPPIFSNLSYLSPSIARNIGAQKAKGKILLFSDADCILPVNWINDMIKPFQNKEITCIIGNRKPDIGKGLGTFIRKYDFILYSNKFTLTKKILFNLKSLKSNNLFISLSGNNFAIRKTIWFKLGGMKEIFKNPAGEDLMLETELIKNGYSILFNPRTKIIHNHPISIIGIIKKAFQRGKGNYLLSKYSDNFISWKYFVERGHMLHLKKLFIGIFFIIIFLLINIVLKIKLMIILSSFLGIVLIINFKHTIIIKNKLNIILIKTNKNFLNISLLKLFFFNQIHFVCKTITSIIFSWYLLKDYVSLQKLLSPLRAKKIK